MENFFKQIEEAIKKQLIAGLEQQETNGAEQNLGFSIGVDFNEQLDQFGNFSTSYEGKFLGATIHANVKVNEPVGGILDIDAYSSQGDSFHRYGLKIPCTFSASLKTESWLSSTKISGKIHCSIPNVRIKGHAEVGY